MTPRTLSDPTIGEGVLEPTEPVGPYVIDGFFILLVGDVVWTDSQNPTDWSYPPDDDCPF